MPDSNNDSVNPMQPTVDTMTPPLQAATDVTPSRPTQTTPMQQQIPVQSGNYFPNQQVAYHQMIPSTPFFQTKYGIMLKSNLLSVISGGVLVLAFLLLFAPFFAGQNYYSFLGKSAVMWVFYLLILVLISYFVAEFLNLSFLKKYPRAFETGVTGIFGFLIGFLVCFGALLDSFLSSIYNSVSSMTMMYGVNSPTQDLGLGVGYYFVIILIVVSAAVFLFRKQIKKMVKM